MSAALEIICAKINEAIKSGDKPVWTAPGPIQGGCHMKDGGWKTRALVGGEEFFFDKIYVGKRKDLIFSMEPVDDQEFSYMEFFEKHMPNRFPLVMDWAAKALSGDGETKDWDDAKSQYMELAEKEAQELADMTEAEAKKKEEDRYSDHKEWGQF